jgi:hypothetical protein
MEGISDILSRKNFDEPAEATAIKKFVYAKYKKSVAVTVREKDILIACQGASFTAALRMQWRDLRKAANTDKRLVFQIA